MILNMSFKSIGATEALKAFTEEKSRKLEKYFRGRISITWNFDVIREDQIAHCHLVGNHMDYFVEAKTSDLYASIEQAVDRLEKQLKKRKEIVKDHLHKHARAR
jgi:putative sigma-54 modulation protein